MPKTAENHDKTTGMIPDTTRKTPNPTAAALEDLLDHGREMEFRFRNTPVFLGRHPAGWQLYREDTAELQTFPDEKTLLKEARLFGLPLADTVEEWIIEDIL